MMIHGLLVGNLASWYFTGASALAKQYSVLLYDLRGHGRSERPDSGYNLSEMTRDLEGLVSHNNEALTLVGHSYGALVALNFAVTFPERVKQLVLVEAPLPPSNFPEFTQFIEQSPDQMIEAMPHELQAVVSGGGRRARRFVTGLYALATQTTILSDLRKENDISDNQLEQLHCPVLAIYGNQSSCRPVAERLRHTLPNCKTTLIDGGHFLPMEQPQELLEQIQRFLRG